MTIARLILLAGLLTLAALAGCRSAHTTSAILYIEEQKYDKAVQVIHEGFQYSENEPDAYFYLGEAYSGIAEEAVATDDFLEARKNLELAYDAYSRCLEINREEWSEKVGTSLEINYNNRMRQARLDWNDKYYEQAEGHLRLAYAALPDSLTPIMSIARMKMQMSIAEESAPAKEALLTEALTLLDQVLAAHPEAYELRIDKANVLDELGRNDEARTLFDDLVKEHGDDTGLLLDIAELAYEQGDLSRSADFFVKVVDLNEKDTDAGNDADNKIMLVRAGTLYATPTVGRYDDAMAVLDRAAELENIPSVDTMRTRLRTYYNYAMDLNQKAKDQTDPALKADLEARSKGLFQRTLEIGVAMTENFLTDPDGFFYLSAAQMQLGDYTASEANFKIYEELKAGGGQ